MKVAVIGYGRWGKNLYNALNKLENVDEVLICDPIFENIESKTKTIKFNEIINDKELNAVVVSTPAKTHFDLTKSLLEANKNVFCEKPLCFTEEELQILTNLVHDKKKIFISGHTFLFNDSIRFLKDYIEKNNLEFKTVFGKYSSYGTNVKDVDVLWDFGPHVISIINYILDSTPYETNIYPISHREDGKLESCYLNLKFKKPKTNE